MSIELMLKGKYAELCAQRDQVNAKNAPLELELDKANAEVIAAQAKAHAIAAKIDDNRGREAWITLKREIGVLARALNPGR
jgi:hypothetical protein